VHTGWFGTGETRLARLRQARDQGYKPMVKAPGAQRESDGVVVPVIGVRDTPGGKGPGFDHAHEVGKYEGMTGLAGPIPPAGHRLP
jgi:hypothetical protein